MTERAMITRTAPLLDFEIDRSGDGRTVVAYAAAFGNLYEVRDTDGHYDEKINPAAFNGVLARSGTLERVKVYYNHALTVWGTPSSEFSLPIGTPQEIKPDGRGLLTRTHYAKSPLGEEVLQMWADGRITGQSFRGAIFPGGQRRTERGPNGRPIIERMQLGLTEYGPTPSPANTEAGLVAIRSLLLDQVAGLSPEERAELAQLLAETPTLDRDHHEGHDEGHDKDHAADAAPVLSPAPSPAPGLSADVLELANANRRRRTP